MKQFFKTMFASMLGFFLGILFLFFLMLIIGSMVASSLSNQEVVIKDNSILHLRLDSELKERTGSNPFDSFDFGSLSSHKQPGLNDILKMIKKASRDEKIKGIIIDLPQYQGGIASSGELRQALIDFRKSGKFIYAFADYYPQGSYFIASAADKVYLNPKGQVMITGLAAELMFFKGTLEKLEVEPQIIRHGKYKSAIEPFILEKMSEENREQISAFIDPIWANLSGLICKSRKIDPVVFKSVADSMLLRDANDALEYRFVDKLAYYDEFIADVKKSAGIGADDDLPLISLNRYKKVPEKRDKGSTFPTDKVAVIYAVGTIENGEGAEERIGSDDLAASIRKAREDDKVKAIVLRVNSPGGDALASEEIWREVVLARKAKPLIVSMGDLAASGGYYISCAADKIVTQPNTLTGSIGVFGLMFNAEKMLKNKLGITTDTYKTNPYTDIGSMTRPMTESERLILQDQVDNVYDIFTKRVADGRGMRQSAVDSIGQGRVWCGAKAIELGLADTLGGLNDAIDIAARKAGITNYRTIQLPEEKEFFVKMMEEMAAETRTMLVKEETGAAADYVNAVRELLRIKGIQALSPYRVFFN